jgi:hypothetical protein
MHAMGVHSLSIGGRCVEGSEILCWLFGDHHFALSKSCRQNICRALRSVALSAVSASGLEEAGL